NTSDGLDLLYHTLGGSVTLTRVRAEANAGNQIKVAGTATITNCVLVGNCAFFDGQSFTFNVDNCRAMGNTLELSYTGGDDVVIANSTFYGQGDGLVGAGASDGCECTGAERLTGVNNLFLGSDEFLSPGDISFLFYQEECPGLIFKGNYSLAYNVKNRDAPYVDPPYPSAHNLFQNPGLAGPFSGATYGMTLTPGSPAIDAGTSTGAPADDINGQPRDSLPDMGAYEYSDAAATATPTPSPALDLEVSPLTAGRGFTIDLSLYKEIRGPSDFYLVAETPFGMYTIDLVGKITAGVRALYKNVPRAAAPQKKRISVRAAVPSSLAGEDVRFYTGAVKTGRVPGVPLAEISMRSPHMLAFDREAATVRHRGR
ncbi:MAG: hypothetical protein NT045_02840, partial [Candidatus Aureabacteria bacterium]|nr:hypothetical protein [Candidatus Auribacterota bacterium]